jgi:hypothetical protein
MLGHHADAVPLAQTRKKVFLRPVELEAVSLDIEHFRHVTADHPANLDRERRLLRGLLLL